MYVSSPPLKIVPIKMDTGAVHLRTSSRGIHPGALDLALKILFDFVLSVLKNAVHNSTISFEQQQRQMSKCTSVALYWRFPRHSRTLTSPAPETRSLILWLCYGRKGLGNRCLPSVLLAGRECHQGNHSGPFLHISLLPKGKHGTASEQALSCLFLPSQGSSSSRVYRSGFCLCGLCLTQPCAPGGINGSKSITQDEAVQPMVIHPIFNISFISNNNGILVSNLFYSFVLFLDMLQIYAGKKDIIYWVPWVCCQFLGEAAFAVD